MPHRTPRRLHVASLEDRLAPATFTGVGPALTINLTNPGEAVRFSTNGTTITAALTGGTVVDGGGTGINVSGFGSRSATIVSAGFTSIAVTDGAAGNSVAFANSAGLYPQTFNINLNDAASGNVTFAGGSVFSAAFTANTAAGFIASVASASLAVAGADLTLTAAGHDVLLAGAVGVGGATLLQGSVVRADHPTNNFLGSLRLVGVGVASVADADALTLGASTFAFGSLDQTSRITAGGSVTQTGALTMSGTGTLAVASAGGSVVLNNGSNNFGANTALDLSATGANPVTVVANSLIRLADVRLGTGALSLTANGNISQRNGTTIRTDGAVNLTVTILGNRDIDLDNPGNRIGGAVSVAEASGGDVRDVRLRNAADNAAPPTGTPLTTAGDVRDLILFFDNNGVALPGYSITGNLNVTAGGDVTQAGGMTVPGTTTVTVQGDFAIALDDLFNTLSGNVSLHAPQSAQTVAVVNGPTLALGASNLGRGPFVAFSRVGDITSNAAITQRKPSGGGTFTANFIAAGGSIALTGANNFPGGILFDGLALTNVNVRNTNPQARFTDLILPGTVTDLTVQFDNAPAVLPSVVRTNLTVNAQGIVQQPGSALDVSGTAFFTGNAFPIDLSSAGNDFTDLRLANSGRNDVIVTDVNGVFFTGSSTLGTGRLTVTAGGSISQFGSISQAAGGPAGDVRFISSGTVLLDLGNTFRGPVSVAVTGAGAVNLNNLNFDLTLGSISTGTGAFTATTTGLGLNLVQDPNSVLSLGGPSTFSASTITLANRTNTFGGPVALSGTIASVRATGAVVLAASNVFGLLSVTTGGAAGHAITQTGPVTGGPSAAFDAGAGDVLLNAANDFGLISVTSTGSAVAVTDAFFLNIGSIRVGGGTLTLTAALGGINLLGLDSAIVQSGPGPITLDTAAGETISLALIDNVLRGPVNVIHSGNVTVRTRGDLTFAPGSTVTGVLNAAAGGVLTLPANLTGLAGLFATARSTTIGSDVAVGPTGIKFTGAVTFTGDRTLTSGGDVVFNGDVTAGGALTFAFPGSQAVVLGRGIWDQAANDLTLTGAGAELVIGDTSSEPAVLHMTAGTISLPGGGEVLVERNGTLRVGSAAGPETVTVANGNGPLTIEGALGVGFGTVNDRLVKTGNGRIDLGTRAELVGSGLAGPTASPVLVSQTALITGRFANSVDAADAPLDFFAGSDIVTPAYSFTDVTVRAGGVAAPGGMAAGVLPDGDLYTVKSSLGAAAGLVTVEDPAGRLAVVVRNATAAVPSTLTLGTAGGGDGQLSVGGVMVHAPGAVTVTAPAANFVGRFTTAGPLKALTARDLGGFNQPFTLTGGGPATAATAVTARKVRETSISLAGALAAFKAVSAIDDTRLTAQKFGTLTTTGSAATGTPGDFKVTLTSTTGATGTVVTSAAVAGQLTGAWDLRGRVGTVKAGRTAFWRLGTFPGRVASNADLLTDITSLALGPVDSSEINATGAVASLTTSDVNNSSFSAGSFGTVKVAANSALGLIGNFTDSSLTATGNVAGVAIKNLTVAGNLSGDRVTARDGDIGTIAVGRTVESAEVTARDTGTRGHIKAITAGRWDGGEVDARSVGSLKVTGNLAAGLFGDFVNGAVTARGNLAGVGLGTFDARGIVFDSTFDLQSGNLTTFKVGRHLGGTDVRLTDPAFGALGTIQAGEWTFNVGVVAETIGTAAAVGAPAAGPASPLLLGGIGLSAITAYQAAGTAAAVGKLAVKGDLIGSSVSAERGIGSVAVGREVFDSFLVADDAQAGAVNVGRIPTLTAGAWVTTQLSAHTLGTVKVTGYKVPENPLNGFRPGNVNTGTFVAHGATPTAPIGIGTFTVGGSFVGSTLAAPFGIKTVTVGGTLSVSRVFTDTPANPAAGFLTTFSAGELSTATIRAGSIGTVKVTGNVGLSRLGSANNSTIVATATPATPTGPRAIGSLTVAGDAIDLVVDAPGPVGSIAVAGRVNTAATGTRIQAGYGVGAGLGSLTAGTWGLAGNQFTELASQSVGTFTLKGNPARGIAGSADRAFIDILGNAGGVGLGTFTATGTIANSLFRVSDGDVDSFTASRFLGSDLLVGFRPVKGSDITLAPPAANWAATNRRIRNFVTTHSFDVSDPADSASLADSTVVAAILGTVSLSGVDPDEPDTTAFGVAFRAGAGAAAKGVVKKGGATLSPGAADGRFNYLGLPG